MSKHIHYYSVTIGTNQPVNFATRALAEASLRISYHHHPKGPPRLFDKANGRTEIRQGPFDYLPYERTKTDPESGTLLGIMDAIHISVCEEATHL